MTLELVKPMDGDLRGKSWGEVVDVFLSGGVDTANTRRQYSAAVRRAFAVMGVTRLDQVTPLHLARYRQTVMFSDLAPGSKKVRLVALRSFLRWTRSFELHDLQRDVWEVALRVPRGDTLHPYNTITEEQISALLRVANRRPRDLAMVMTMLGAGLRVSEVSNLDIRDLVHGDTPMINVRNSKGGRSREVPVHPEVMASLRTITNGRSGNDPVFRTARGPAGRLHIPGMRDRLEYLGEEAGIGHVTPHQLRHTFATRSVSHTGNVMAVMKLLGHRQLSTTQRYLDHVEQAALIRYVPPLPAASTT